MVGGSPSDFTRGHPNAILRGIGEEDWDDFTVLVEKHFQSTNEKDQNWLALQNLKQKGHPMDMFLLKFENYALLADYGDTQQIELLEQNADKEIVSHFILEKGHYASLRQFKADLQQAGACKQLLDFIQKGTAERVKQKDPNAMDIDAIKTGKTNVSTVSKKGISAKIARKLNFSAPSATSSEVVTRRPAPRGAKARAMAARCTPPRLKTSTLPPGMRIKAPTRTTSEKVATAPLP